MNYYPHHIGDFDKATRHLTRIERSIYRDLLDVYYDTEQPLTLDMAALCRKIIARTDEERTAVEQTLNEFFTKTDAGWSHERCDEEIAAYHKKLGAAANAGRASAAKRAAKTAPTSTSGQQASAVSSNACSTGVEQPLNDRATNQNQNQNQNQKEQEQRQALAQAAIDTASQAAKAAPAARSASAQGSRLPADWMLPDEWRAWAVAEHPDWPPAYIEKVAAGFRDYWVGVPGQQGRKVDWQATWRNWVRKERGPQGTQTNNRNGATRHGNFATQDYRAGVTAEGFF